MDPIDEATAHWPGVHVDADDVRAYAESLDGAIADDAWPEVVLACACRRGDPTALALFDRHYLDAAVPAVAHMKLGRAQIDDVRQQVADKLLVGETPKIDAYVGQGRLRGLVQVMAVRSAISMQRKLRKGSDEALGHLPADEDDPELRFMKEAYRAAFREAFAEAAGALTSRERNLFRLQLDGGLTVEQLGEVYGVHRATVTRWLTKARRRLLEETRRGLQRRTGVAPGELDSLMGLIQSRLDVSVRRLLETTNR